MPQAVAGPPLPAEFPQVTMDLTAEKGKVRAEFPQGDYRNARPHIDIYEADDDGKVVLPDDAGTIWLAAMATRVKIGPGKQDLQAHWQHPITGKPIAKVVMKKWSIAKGRDQFRNLGSTSGPQITFLFRGEGVANAMWKSVDIYDAQSLMRLNKGGAFWERENPAVYKIYGPMWNDGPAYLLVEFAYGKFEEARGSVKPGTVLRLPGAMAALYHLQSGLQRGASFGYDEPSFVESRVKPPTADKSGTVAICGFLPFELGGITDIELIDRTGNRFIATAGNSNDYIFNQYFPGVLAEDVVEFRVKKRPHRARMIIKLPKLLGMPNRRDETSDLFDQKIPYVKFSDIDKMTRFIGTATHLPFFPSVKERAGIESLTFPRSYKNATLREMMDEISKAIGARIEIDPESDRVSLVPE